MEIVAVLFSLISVWLTSKNNILCWPTGIIGIIAFSCVFYTKGEFANFWLQGLFLVQSIYAWINWGKNNDIKYLKKTEIFNISIYLIPTLFIISYLTIKSTHPVLDTITATLSIFGMFLLLFRKIEAWYFWILADILYIILFLKDDLYLSSLVYIIFLVMSIYGYKNWKKIKNGI
jgi:nicotinamide mononucleotide transporter